MASRRRLNEEMGIDSKLTRLFDFVYRAELEDGLIEHEYDHVLVGHFDGVPNPNCHEVAEWKWIDLAPLRIDIAANPSNYTYWFRLSLNRIHEALQTAQAAYADESTLISSNI